MQGWKEPKNSDKYYWTTHAKSKMRQYGLSAQRVVRVIRKPIRTEEGIVSKTVAVMQPQSTKKGEDGQKTWTNEIWVMYQIKKTSITKGVEAMDDKMLQFLNNLEQDKKQIKIISVWRYPGKTDPRESLPEHILDEIAEVV